MAVDEPRHTTPSNSPRPNSVAETIQIYPEDVPPPTPLKDAKYTKASQQRSLADSFDVFKANNMYSSKKVYEFETNRRDSVLDPPLGPFVCYFDPKTEGSVTQLVVLGNDFTEALQDTYCSSTSSGSTVSPRESLLPPLPEKNLSPLRIPVIGQSTHPPPQRPLRISPLCEQALRKPTFGSPSQRSFTPLELEQLRQPPLTAVLHRSPTPFPTSASTLNYTRPIAPSISSSWTSSTSRTLQSSMSSFSNSETVRPPNTPGSSCSAPTRNRSMIPKRSGTHKPANIVQPEFLSTTVPRQCISLPLETKSNSPVGADFDLGLPSHDFETRRQIPCPPATDAIVLVPNLISACTTTLGTPTSLSIQPLLSPFQEQPVEISAFDSDSDDEGRCSHGRSIREKLSIPLLKQSRTLAETVPAARTRNTSKGAALPARILKQDIKTPGLRFSNVSEHGTGCGVTTVRSSDSSTASPVALKPSAVASLPATLRKKMSKTKSQSSKSKRTSNTSKASKRSGTSSKTTVALVAGSPFGGKKKVSSGKRLRNWFARIIAMRATH